MEDKLYIGQDVFVMRQIGKKGIPTRTRGYIKLFSSTILVNGEPTAKVVFSGKKDDWYWFPISKIESTIKII
jgi:hypothetical protein